MSLRRLARFCYRRRRLVVVLWLAALVGINVLAAVTGTNFTTNFSAPNTESTRASNLLAANFKAQSGDTVQVVMQGTPSMHDAAVRAAGDTRSSPRSNKIPHVVEREQSVHDAGRHLEVGNRRARERAARREVAGHLRLRRPADDRPRRAALDAAARGASSAASSSSRRSGRRCRVRASASSPRSSSC